MDSSSPNWVENKKISETTNQFFHESFYYQPKLHALLFAKKSLQITIHLLLVWSPQYGYNFTTHQMEAALFQRRPPPAPHRKVRNKWDIDIPAMLEKGVHRWRFLPGHKPNISETPWNKSCENGDQKPITLKEKPITLKEKPITLKENPITLKENPITLKENPITLKEKPITLKENLKSSPHDFRAGFKSLFFLKTFWWKNPVMFSPSFWGDVKQTLQQPPHQRHGKLSNTFENKCKYTQWHPPQKSLLIHILHLQSITLMFDGFKLHPGFPAKNTIKKIHWKTSLFVSKHLNTSQ